MIFKFINNIIFNYKKNKKFLNININKKKFIILNIFININIIKNYIIISRINNIYNIIIEYYKNEKNYIYNIKFYKSSYLINYKTIIELMKLKYSNQIYLINTTKGILLLKKALIFKLGGLLFCNLN